MSPLSKHELYLPGMKAVLLSLKSEHEIDKRNEPDLNMLIL